MRTIDFGVMLAAIIAGSILLPHTTSAASLGRASMPSTVAQYLGYGYGAGRHAPIVRTPGMHPERVPRNVRVPRYAGPLYPAPYEQLRCYGEECYGNADSMAPELAPAAAESMAPTPATTPMPTPAPAPERQAWRRPF